MKVLAMLLLVLGCATRLARFLPDAPKTYEGILALGVTTTTDDLAGSIVCRHEGPLPGVDRADHERGDGTGAHVSVAPWHDAPDR